MLLGWYDGDVIAEGDEFIHVKKKSVSRFEDLMRNKLCIATSSITDRKMWEQLHPIRIFRRWPFELISFPTPSPSSHDK